MKPALLPLVLSVLLTVIFGGIVLHAPLTVFIDSHWPSVGDIAKAWKELLLVVIFALMGVEVTRQRAWQRLVRDRLLWIVGAYSALHILVALADAVAMTATIAGLMIDLRFVAFFAAVYIFVGLYPQYKKLFLQIVVIGASVVIGFAIVQQVLPRDFLAVLGYGDQTIQPYLTVDQNPDFVRHSSTLRGPNPLGAYALIVVTGLVAWASTASRSVKVTWHKYLYMAMAIGSLIALWTSHSRSAWIGAAAAIGIVIAVRFVRRLLAPRVISIIGIGIVMLGVVGYMIRDSYFVHNVILHDNPTTGPVTTSNQGHLDSLIHGTEKMLHEPFGYGVGSTGSASLYTSQPQIIENQYLFIAHETGWLGLALFIVLYGVLLRRLWCYRHEWLGLTAFASGIGLAIIGVLLPVWADDTVAIIWWGLAAIIIAGGMHDGQPTKQKTARTT